MRVRIPYALRLFTCMLTRHCIISHHYTNADPQTVWPPRKSRSFPLDAPEEKLITHCEVAHAAACRRISAMNGEELDGWKKRQMANAGAP